MDAKKTPSQKSTTKKTPTTGKSATAKTATTAKKPPVTVKRTPPPKKTAEQIAEEKRIKAEQAAAEKEARAKEHAAQKEELAKLPFKEKVKRIFSKKDDKPKKEPVRFLPDVNEGLSSAQVDDRISEGFYNKSVKKYSKTYRSIFVGNICTFFNLLCLLAAVALMLARAPWTQFTFVLIFLCNIVFSIVQEIRAKRKIDKLTILSSPTAKVIRNGKQTEIPVGNLVLDDVLLLSAGQQVPADCICLEGQAELNESLLTGESVPIKKEYGNQLYAGSFVSSGKCAVRVDKIGEDTYISQLTARAKTYKRPKSEIMNSITLFIKIIGLMIIPVALLMFFTNYTDGAKMDNWGQSVEAMGAQGGFFHMLFGGNEALCDAIQKTCAVVIGMIPSGLLLLTTIALSVGMIRLAHYNTLVQDMYSLEMLARVNVLCLDKTGTITDGRMKVSDCILLNNPTEYSTDDILGSMLLSLEDNNQTSIALYERFGHSQALQATHKLPFSSQRKLSAVTFGNVGTFVLGAPEFVLHPMPTRISKIVKQYAQMGLRVMVLAHSPSSISGDKIPASLRAIAILTLSDNIRPDAIETIKWFKENEVDVKVISGDNPVTVSEVARRAGIRNASQFISLEGLSDIEVENAANQYTVFGRVTPEQKAILIRSIKKAGNTVAMTGDGVNDILAMKEADCAVSVASGSEAARNVSNLVLQDSNFASMPKIVNEGRRVINNIKDSASLYIMKTLLTVLLATVCISTQQGYFFTANNMMLYEMLISALPSFVLSLQPNTERVKGKFIPFVVSRALPGAFTMAICLVSVFIISKTGLCASFGFNNDVVYKAILTLVLTFTGLVMLYRICQPFNVVRAVLFICIGVLCALVLSIPFLGGIVIEGWANIHLTLPQILLIIILVQAAVPLSGILIRFFDMFNPAED
ncbi:MAG: HAD-IC family P-type ATPase [Clostridia bacterium]|nr:HAD-IC family P-type ATPase [Clostridia bacterium]